MRKLTAARVSEARSPRIQRVVPAIPKVGDQIYVDHVDVIHQTYVRGGVAEVTEVFSEASRCFVRVAEFPGVVWPWDYLGPLQIELREEYGGIRAGKYIMRPEDR